MKIRKIFSTVLSCSLIVSGFASGVNSVKATNDSVVAQVGEYQLGTIIFLENFLLIMKQF